MLIHQQMSGAAQVEAKHIAAQHRWAQDLMERRRAFKFKHTYREHNKMADFLANEVMTRRSSRATHYDNSNDLTDEQHERLLPLLAQNLRFDPHRSSKSQRPTRHETAVT